MSGRPRSRLTCRKGAGFTTVRVRTLGELQEFGFKGLGVRGEHAREREREGNSDTS